MKEDVCQAEIILGNVPAEFLKESKNLKWIQLNNVGENTYTEKDALFLNIGRESVVNNLNLYEAF